MRSDPIQNRTLSRSPGLDVSRHDLMSSLARLVDDLVNEKKTDRISNSADESDIRWEDDQNIYLEILIPFKSDREIDIFIVEGKAFIRLDR